jgi:hypothetical protein
MREWEAGAIDELLVKPLGITLANATLLTLLAGLSTSTTYVSRFWQQHSVRELQYFREYLDEEKTWLKTEIAKPPQK